MKRIVNYIVSMVLVVFFLLAGTGMNVVHYCCQDCRRAGLEHVLRESCISVHDQACECCHRHAMHTAGEQAEECHHEADGCWIHHYTIEQVTIAAEEVVPPVGEHSLLAVLVGYSYLASPMEAAMHLLSALHHHPNRHGEGQHVIVMCCRWLK